MTEHKTLENWFVGQVEVKDDYIQTMPVIRGFVDGTFIQFAPLLWLDLEKKIAMTDNKTYKVGKPNQQWITRFLAEGHTIDDLEIKETNH